ncbi:MAG: sugar phosphate isomerase/epimerase [Thermoguttaceae bacterium]|nr:sugar phosphate isomerase/epimerase [Thermoguttaceae bacterium]MBR5757193.1 sugar phosphate isomerase/epimerase [Thermoguttaceae bacterium]
MNRRDFFGTGAVLGLGLAGASLNVANAQTTEQMDKRAEAKLRISSQVGPAPGKDLPEKLAKIKKYGCEAVEYGGDCVGHGKERYQMAADAGLEVGAICWGSHNGDLCSEDESKRQPGIDDLKKAIETAAEMKSPGVIYVPAFNGQTKLTNQEIRELLLEFLPPLAEFANSCGTNIIFEPLCRMEAYFLRQVADGASIARDVLRKAGIEGGIGVMGDFYHMDTEETSQMGALISAGPLLKYIHLAGGVNNPRRTYPGENDMTFVDGFRGLKYIGYQGFCSFECGCAKEDKEQAFQDSIAFLRAQWELA